MVLKTKKKNIPKLTKLSIKQKIKLLFRLKKKMKKKGFDLTLRLLNKIIPKTKTKIEKKLVFLHTDKYVLLSNTIDDILLKYIIGSCIKK